MDFWLKQTENELRLLNYSRMTIKNYLRCLKDYFSFLTPETDLKILNKETVKKFLLEKLNRGKSGQTVNLHLNAIGFFYKHVIKNHEKIGLKFAKRPKKLPIVLTRDEILRILGAIQNKKHKLMISLAYSAGLRVSEVINLKIRDIQLENLSLFIKQSKGNRDRITVFSKKLREDLKQFTAGKEPKDFIFESERGGKMTSRTAQKIFEKARDKANITKPATFHSLRHSFATHLIEQNVNIRYVQELLGHRNIRTTQMYIRVTNLNLKNIKSPL